ncbi:DUF4350 domain-containing protein [Microlunatus sp. GCM10028923]|uniref:DUF4350 domain-containing protein n=1 Tax=Microlunatus sp. GCM10028923 TaxID=3273400 RepID=UPI00360C4086
MTAPTVTDEPPTTPVEPPQRPGWSRFLRHRATRWVAGVLVVVLIVLGTVAAFSTAVAGQAENDPRSSGPDGARAVATVLQQEGVEVRPTERIGDAVRDGAGATVVVAYPDRLSDDQVRQLLEIPDARLILLGPDDGLGRFVAGVESSYADGQPVDPGCADPTAERAGSASFAGGRTFRAEATPTVACYETENGHGYLRLPSTAGPEIELLGGGWTNSTAAADGNAALVLGLLGSRERLIWVMASGGGPGSGDQTAPPPTVLPPWWAVAVAQAVVALIIVGIWRGRRLGPIILERLPVRVRASETVEGHGQLYHRLQARERAAAALREGVVRRLGRRYGHGNDPMALAAALAERTGRDSRQVYHVLFGPVPDDDDQLLDLAENLDDLEQEARQP